MHRVNEVNYATGADAAKRRNPIPEPHGRASRRAGNKLLWLACSCCGEALPLPMEYLFEEVH